MKFTLLPYQCWLRSLFILSLLISLVACGMLPFTQPESPQEAPKQEKVLSLVEQANIAYASGDMAKAEQLYSRVVYDNSIAQNLRAQAWQPYILASLANEHPYSAIENMANWQKFVPDADTHNAWQQTWLKVITNLPFHEQTRRIRLALGQGSLIERVLAESLLMAQSPSSETQESIINNLSTFYTQAKNTDERAALERAVFNAWQYAPDATLATLLAQTGPERDHVFPWTIVLLETLRREQGKHSPNVPALLGRINYPSLFADVSLLLNVIKAQSSSEIRSGASRVSQSDCVALALPMSGPYSPVAWKIARGASAAQAELIAAGHQLELLILNTDQPSWLERLAALPPQCVAIGGPMQPSAYAAAKQRGLLQSRALFAFMSRLDEGEEGKTAWRFFSSQADQIRTGLQFTNALGLHAYSVLAPNEPYGQRMTDLFVQELGKAPTIATYNPTDSTTWNQISADFVNVRMLNDIPIPASTMQAVFIPDTWQNAEIMIPYILFQGEDRLVFMGTTLWEEGLSKSQRNSIQSIQLALFPGIWNDTSPSPKAKELIEIMSSTNQEAPDLWVALGYDFVRFASILNLPSDFTPDTVNNRLVVAQQMPWSMAPIKWDDGKAKQQLFLFTPLAQGFELANLETFSDRLKRIYARHERRIGKAKQKAREEAGKAKKAKEDAAKVKKAKEEAAKVKKAKEEAATKAKEVSDLVKKPQEDTASTKLTY